ncbi:hypothetical protein MLD38_034042 [Melastoma candidum]|uniref:Uncharacterized protein n=1 Tax=Melastoma candidum TaxID=119954 RepID=A0ACB9M8P7_9MYRT|nr:hypothetical protein MLD38_034042 [Melastoma candidum]
MGENWQVEATTTPFPFGTDTGHLQIPHQTSAVKFLAWCPFRENMLASGGGMGDHCIKFWNTQYRDMPARELLSSHGFTHNQLAFWKYPSLVKMAELTGHTSRAFSWHSQDGCTVASAPADETLRFGYCFTLYV